MCILNKSLCIHSTVGKDANFSDIKEILFELGFEPVSSLIQIPLRIAVVFMSEKLLIFPTVYCALLVPD